MRIRLAITMAVLALSLSVSATAQDPELPGVSLADQCLINAADEETLATCTMIVATVLDPAATGPRLVEVTGFEDYMAGLLEALPDEMLLASGTLQTTEATTKKEKRAAKRADREAARAFADTVRAYQLSLIPDPCYANAYAAGWRIASAFDLWANDLVKNANRLAFNDLAFLIESGTATSCFDEGTAVETAPEG